MCLEAAQFLINPDIASTSAGGATTKRCRISTLNQTVGARPRAATLWHGPCDGTRVNPTTAIVLVASQQRRPRRSRAYREQAMNFDKLSRRHLLKGTAALTLGTALPLRGAFAAETTVGFIYVGARGGH